MNGGAARLLGRWGEAVAAEDLRRKGWRLVAAGWQCRFGEIDLIAENSKYITFIEVKLRKNADFAPARAAGGAIGGEEEDDPQQYHQGKGHAGKTGVDILPEAGLQVLREVGHRTPPRLSKKGVLSMGNRDPCGRGG